MPTIDELSALLRDSVNAPAPSRTVCSAAAIRIVAKGKVAVAIDAGTTAFPGIKNLPKPPESIDAATRFDLASLTKVFTALTTLTTCLENDIPLDTQLPDSPSTIREALTHTSGYPSDWADAHDSSSALLDDDPAERWRRFFEIPLESTPGTAFRYSDLGFVRLGRFVEKVTALPLDVAMTRLVLNPLGLHSTGFCPGAGVKSAATEFDKVWRKRIVWGEVHDETAFLLGGRVGNAGLFSTADDVARFAEALRRGTVGQREDSTLTRAISMMTRPALREGIAAPFRIGLGVRIADRAWMGSKVSAQTFGHTGFTGTSFFVDPVRQLSVVLLTNRVHPDRARADLELLRRRVADYAIEWGGPL